MALGYRMEAISILGLNVMAPRGLLGLGQDSLTACGPEIVQCLRAFLPSTSTSPCPILIHCTQGKDRTGLIVLLVLLLLDIPVEAIEADYRRSEKELEPEMEERMKEIRSIGLGEEFARCPEGWCGSMKEFLEEKWGGVGKYCEEIGFGEDEQQELRQALRAEN